VQPSHLGFIDYLRTPESGKVGVDMRFARGAKKGSDGKMYTPVINMKTGQTEYKTPQELAETPLVFPGENKSDMPMVSALVGGKFKYVPKEKAEYLVPHMDDTFSSLTNMVPMKSMVKGQRVIMGSRMFTQALPLANAEAPFVQSARAEDPASSHEDEMGEKMGAIKAHVGGTVESVSPDNMVIRDQTGEKHTVDLYNDMPFNRKTFWTQKPTVQPGDVIKPGQLIATSNFTDKNGTAALGLNLRVGYTPFRGRNYEDAVVISASAAKKLTSDHMYQHEAEWDDNTHVGKKAFMSLFPSEYDKKMLENFDDNGAIKKGATVNYGDPLVLVAKKRDTVYGRVHRGRAGSFANETVTWEHHTPGIVTDVEHTKKGVSVVVKSQAQMEVGDKITGRFGDKGVVSEIVPDHQMPQDGQGNPMEILVSPLGLINRVNPAQIIEAALGKVAAKTGAAYKVKDFDNDNDMIDFATKELAKHGMTDTEDLIDPETGRKIKGVLTGNRFFMKLHHTAESKGQGRSIGSYTAEGTPAKGGAEGAKRVGMLELGALLSHGAGKVVRDSKMVRGQANPEYWTQFMAGYDPPLPKVPHVYEKFVNQLRASGVNTVRTGTRTHIMALTDKNIDELSGGREIQNSETVDWKGNLKPIKGGLFDETLTGGHNGNRWAKITLHEPMPNPIMEDPIRRTLGLTEQKFRAVLAGQEKLGDKTGPQAIQAALAQINVPKAIDQAREDIKSGRKTLRDAAVRRLGFLKGAEATGVHPQDWMTTKVGVLPPAFRPVSTMGAKKLPLVDDANYLYKELLDANSVLKESAGMLSDYGDQRLAVYDSMKAVTGLGDPQHPKNVERNVRGFLSKIFGDSPKFGTMQRKLLSSTVDLVGRAVISPNPDLDMDEVALPEDKAWEIYKPFVVRGLVRRGMPRLQALQSVQDRHKAAADELQTQMNSKPIVINRAPVLHRYGVMAFYPRMTKNKVMEVNPVITKGFGADFDGDAMQYHVPSTDDAAKEAIEKMLPSKNLFSTASFKAHYVPNKDYQTGVYLASSKTNKKSKPRVYRNKKDALAAYRRGEIDVDTPVHIVEDND
jgi:biotin carboxyl carrier protein